MQSSTDRDPASDEQFYIAAAMERLDEALRCFDTLEIRDAREWVQRARNHLRLIAPDER